MTHFYSNRKKTPLERNAIDFQYKTIVIVDDGAATGSTVIAAFRSVSRNMNPKRIIIALPISPKGTSNKSKNEDIDQIEVIASPQNRNFESIEQYYQHFDQITDKQVRYHTKKFRVITNFEQGLFDSLLPKKTVTISTCRRLIWLLIHPCP